MRLRTAFTASCVFLICLAFPTAPIHAYYTNMSASVVIGQNDFSSGSINQGGSAGPNTLNIPSGSTTINSKFIVADNTNHRVLIYNSIPTANNAAADVVIGQTNFTNNTRNQCNCATPGPNTLSFPSGVSTDGQKLFISDTNNHRILIFNQVPTTNNASADVVIGQPDFVTRLTSPAVLTASSLDSPFEVFYEHSSGKLLIPDFSNNRVLIYNRVPTTNGAAADVVIGQVDFTHDSANQGGSAGANTLSLPSSVFVDSEKLFVADATNHRVLIYNSIPTANNASADVVIGQTNFTSASANQGGSTSSNTLNVPRTAKINRGRLFIDDSTNHRVLIYNSVPTNNNISADVVIGQVNFTGGTANQGGTRTSNTFSTPLNLTIRENKLLVSDLTNNRVLIFNDDATAPGLSVAPPQSAENNLIKFTGNATTINRYTIQNVQYMVNGGGFNGATATDGSFDSVNENFFFTFDPKSNNNKEDGYVVQIKSTTSNADTSDHLFYFQPFSLNMPEDRSFISKALPTFSFSVNKQQTQLKENLKNYKVMVKKSGGDWKTYIDSIPVDYATVKDSIDNLQKSSNSNNGNGNYEDKKILVQYSNNNSTITVTPKAVDDQGNSSSLTFDQNGRLLSNDGYEWKVQAVDKNLHVQETDSRKFVVGASAFSNGSSWFPLQVNSITGLGRVYLSTIAPQLVKPKYRIQTSNPIFKGIATANSTVQLDLTNQTCQTKGENNCLQTFTANTNSASQFSLSTSANSLKTENTYQAQFSVSQNGLFNALPPFQISR